MRKRVTGEPLKIAAEEFNCFIDAGEDFRRRTANLGEPQVSHRAILCRVVTEGPDCEADFTDHRYWVQEVSATDASFSTWGPVGQPPFAAVNLAELNGDTVLQHHLVRDRQDIDDDSVTEYDSETAPVLVAVRHASGYPVFWAYRLDPVRREYLHIDTFGEDGAPETGRWERLVFGVFDIENVEIWGPGGDS